MSAVDELRAEAAELYRLLLDTTAERDALSARLQAVRDWATADHGGVKRPIDIWPGLAAALAPLDASLGTPGDDDFYEDDEPVEQVVEAFGEGPHQQTVPPLPPGAVQVTPPETWGTPSVVVPSRSPQTWGMPLGTPADEKPQATKRRAAAGGTRLVALMQAANAIRNHRNEERRPEVAGLNAAAEIIDQMIRDDEGFPIGPLGVAPTPIKPVESSGSAE